MNRYICHYKFFATEKTVVALDPEFFRNGFWLKSNLTLAGDSLDKKFYIPANRIICIEKED